MSSRQQLVSAALVAFALAAVVLAALAPANAMADRPADCDVKAALLFNFLKFVDWNEGRRPLEICIVGETPMLESASLLDGRVIDGRVLKVRRAAHGRLASCRVAFVPRSEGPRIESVARQLSRGALVVGDGPDFAARGAHLNFYVAGGDVRFEANLRAIRRDGIRLSSKVLRLARIVEGP